MSQPIWSTPVRMPSKPLTTTILAELRLSHIILFLVAAVCYKVVYNILLHPLRRVPGPLPARATELWRTRKYALGKWHDDILELHKKYGPVVRVAPNEVSFVDKAALVQIYGHSTGTRKTSWYDVWTANDKELEHGVFNTKDPKMHSFLRKRLATTYSMSTLLTLEPKMQEVADVMWSRLHKVAKNNEVVDLQNETSNFAFDIVSTLGLGQRFGFVDHSTVGSDDIIPSIHGYFYFSAVLGYIPGQLWWLTNPVSQALLKAFAPPWMTGVGRFSAWTRKQVLNRMENAKSEGRDPDLLDHFIRMKDAEGRPVASPAVSMEVGNVIGAGADTTSIGIAVVLGQLATHPGDYRRVQQEIDAAYSEHDADKSWNLDYKTASGLPWFEACIKEAMRMCPSILFQLPREAPANGIEIAGHYIPNSATLSMSPIAHNRSRDIWGDDADEFRPGRWIVGEGSTSEDYVREIEKYNVLFGYGSRTCIGKHLALIEVHKFVGQFVYHFDCELVNKDVPYVRRSQWFCLQEKLLVRLRGRVQT